MEDKIKQIKDLIDCQLESTNGIALSLLIQQDKLKEIGMLDDKTNADIETIRNKLMGAYTCCQYLYKEIREIEKQ